MRRSTFFAKKTKCANGHMHDSKKEAARCHDLHMMEMAGTIDNLVISPRFDFIINDRPVKMANGHIMRFTADFSYSFRKDGVRVVEDVKDSGGFMSRDVPVKLALLRHLYPEIEWRIYK